MTCCDEWVRLSAWIMVRIYPDPYTLQNSKPEANSDSLESQIDSSSPSGLETTESAFRLSESAERKAGHTERRLFHGTASSHFEA